MFESVIFDWDGTLADTRQVVVASFQQALRPINCAISDGFIERLIGIGTKETFREILRVSETSLEEALITKLVENKIRNEIRMSGKVKLFPGVMECLETLQGKVKLGLASMNDYAVINHMIKITDTQRFFDVVVTAKDITKPKPSPEIFLKCAIKLGTNSSKCMVIEDSIFGVKAAKTAEMGCIAVLTGVYSRRELEKAKPDLIIPSLKRGRKIYNLIFH